MMSFGDHSHRAWCSTRTRRAIVKAAATGITFYDTADIYAGGASEVVTATCWEDVRRDDVVVAPRCNMSMGPGENSGGCPASTSCPASTRRCSGWEWTT